MSQSAAAGRVEDLFITDRESAPMQSIAQVRAIAGQGLEGDRYGSKRGKFSGGENEPVEPEQQITLIEAEAIEGARHEYEIELAPIQARRNVLTRGVALNHLVGREFKVGNEVVLRGIRLCEPCGHLEKLTREGVRKSLIHRGGLRAEIVRGGMIHRGDPIAGA
ncbi:MAG: hypothetical protein IT430_08180 [Phycisphaerales bacterium]|nr:hypothetical protein [Phycisphaerales bacterium]